MPLFLFVLTSCKAAVNSNPLTNKLGEKDYARLIKCLEIIETQIELNLYDAIYENIVSKKLIDNRPAKKFQYYINDCAIWSNNKYDLAFFVVLNGINIITVWNSSKEKIEHKNICKFEKDTLNEILIGENKRNVQIIQIQNFIKSLSQSSLCEPDQDSYIGNYFENYDPNDFQYRISILKNIMRDVINAIAYIHESGGFCSFSSKICIVMCKEDNQFIFKLLTLHVITENPDCKGNTNVGTNLESKTLHSSSLKKHKEARSIGLIGLMLYLGKKLLPPVLWIDQKFSHFLIALTSVVNIKLLMT